MPRTATQALVDDALLAICKGERPHLPDAPGLADDLIAAVRHHRIAPLAHVALREAHPELASRLREDRDAALLNHLRVTAVLGGVADVLDGIDWLVFKGPVLSEFAHPVAGLRFYKDLDLLVAPEDLREACRRLFGTGWRSMIGDASLLSKELPGEIPLADRNRVVLDLHWSMVVMKSVRGRFRMAAGPVLQRRVQETIGPARVWRLAPADGLVHVCHHAALIGASRLGHVLDADQLARQVDDWDTVVTRAREWGAGVEVAVVLGRAHRLLGTPLPADLDRRLGLSRCLSRTLENIDRVWPIQRLRRDASWVRVVTKALRPHPLHTAAETTRRVVKGVWVRATGSDAVQPRTSATPEAIDTYLSRVEATGANRHSPVN